MKKITLMLLLTASVASINSFATDKKPVVKAKKTMHCSMGGTCCKKSISKAAMLKSKEATKKA